MKVFKFLGGAWLFIVLFGGMSFAAEPIKIGYIATLTGEGATWGQHEGDGMLMDALLQGKLKYVKATKD